jgi:hypothetical protein
MAKGVTKMKKLIAICVVCVCMTSIAAASIDPWGDSSKMHYPQLPDPYGWDVAFDDYAGTQYPLADDWQCIGTGPVKDIHLWISWQGDRVSNISALHVAIYGDNPKDPENPEDYSTPDTSPLWQGLLYPDMIEYGSGEQGWLDPFRYSVIQTPPDHYNTYQLNITDITNPFIQEEGEIYWLVVNAWWGKTSTYPDPEWPGWKTSEDNWGDDAVYWDGLQWQELRYPYNDPFGRVGQSIDLAFVITPEPATVCLLGLGALSLVRRKK